MQSVHILRKYDPAEWGGTETALLQLCTGLAGQEVKSTVYCPRIPHGLATNPLAESGCTIKHFTAHVPVLGITPEEKCRQIALGGNLVSFDLIHALCREKEVALIHTHTL